MSDNYECPCWTKSHCRYHDAKSQDHAPCCEIAVENNKLELDRLRGYRDAFNQSNAALTEATKQIGSIGAERDSIRSQLATASKERDEAIERTKQVEGYLENWARAAQEVVNLFDPMKAVALPHILVIIATAAKDAHMQVRAERDAMRPVIEAAKAWRERIDEVKEDSTYAACLRRDEALANLRAAIDTLTREEPKT